MLILDTLRRVLTICDDFAAFERAVCAADHAEAAALLTQIEVAARNERPVIAGIVEALSVDFPDVRAAVERAAERERPPAPVRPSPSNDNHAEASHERG
jgi:hypothetical protein